MESDCDTEPQTSNAEVNRLISDRSNNQHGPDSDHGDDNEDTEPQQGSYPNPQSGSSEGIQLQSKAAFEAFMTYRKSTNDRLKDFLSVFNTVVNVKDSSYSFKTVCSVVHERIQGDDHCIYEAFRKVMHPGLIRLSNTASIATTRKTRGPARERELAAMRRYIAENMYQNSIELSLESIWSDPSNEYNIKWRQILHLLAKASFAAARVISDDQLSGAVKEYFVNSPKLSIDRDMFTELCSNRNYWGGEAEIITYSRLQSINVWVLDVSTGHCRSISEVNRNWPHCFLIFRYGHYDILSKRPGGKYVFLPQDLNLLVKNMLELD
jgi:hypothetical protein